MTHFIIFYLYNLELFYTWDWDLNHDKALCDSGTWGKCWRLFTRELEDTCHMTDKTLQEALVEALSVEFPLEYLEFPPGSVSQKQTMVVASWDSKALQLVQKHSYGSAPVSTLSHWLAYYFQWFQRSPRRCPSTAIHVHSVCVSTACTSMIASGGISFKCLLCYLCLPGHLGSVFTLATLTTILREWFGWHLE